MGRKLYAKGEGFNPTTSIEDVEGLREELDALKGGSGGGGGDNTAIERRLSEAEGEIDALQGDVAEQSKEIAAVGAKVNTLQGSDAGKSVRTIAAEETAKIVGDAPDNYNTLKEIADYISSDAEGAAELKNKVNKNATDIATLQSTKASKSEAQGYATTAKNEAIAAAATDAQSKANTAESNANDYTDGAVGDLVKGQVATNTTAIASLQTAQTSTAATVKSQGTTLTTHTQQIASLDSNKLGKTEKAADSAKADSATELATPRKIWGQSFDGSGDVSEEITISGDGRKVVNVKSKAASDYAGLIAYMSTSSPTSETGGVVFNGSSATYKYGGNALNVFNTRGDIHYEAAANYHHIFHNELKFTVVADQDLCAGVRTAFKTSIAQIGALIGNHFYLGKEANDKYIRFRKYTGISNASPSSITDLMTIDTSGNVVIPGKMTATASYHEMNYTTSDERLKDFEGDVEVDLEKLKTLPKKYFKWKEHPERGRTLGTSAQALQKIYPELVDTRTDGMLSVNYEGLAMVALAAVDKLAEQNAELVEQNADSKRRLAKIEKLLNIE